MSKQPVICQVLHSLNIGGAEVLAARLARGLRGGFRFVFACLDAAGELAESLVGEGFPVEYVERRPGIDLACQRRLLEFWRAQHVDLIHAHQYTPFFYSMAARRLRSQPPILFTEHGRWFPDFPRRKRILFNRLVLRSTDRVVGVGEAVRRALIENEGISADRVEVIYNGVDTAEFRGHEVDAAEVRRDLGFRSEEFVAIQVARLDHLKDHLTAIRTMQRVVAQRPEARLLLVGEGPERAAIESEVERRGLAAHVRLLGTRHDLVRLLHAADMFLLTSISEGIPVTLIEAMAALLPVVSTDVGGVSEVVEDGKTGILAPSGDDERLAAAVLRLAGDGQLRQALGEAGRARAEQRFSQAKMHACYAATYREMLGD